MSKVILKFDLPEEREEYENAYNGNKTVAIIEEMDNFLRGKLKYQELTDEQEKIYSEIREKLFELKQEYLTR